MSAAGAVRAADVRPCVAAGVLEALGAHAGLDMFRPADLQHRALVAIARDAPTCVSAAVDEAQLVGYAAFHRPSDVESWGEDRTGRIVELGAVEVAPPYRGQRLAQRLLDVSFADGRFDDTVVIATLYAWHYDLRRSGLTDFAYKRLLEKLYRHAGLETFPTADAEIRSNAANALMARIGPHAPPQVVAEFERLRTRPRFFSRT